MKPLLVAYCSLNLLVLTGCASSGNPPLIFGQSQTVGISIGATASDQGADFVLGYRDKNIAIVPVSLPTASGSSAQITSKTSAGFEDSLSVLGQFEVNSKTTKGDVGLGKFFATGSAATALANGFKRRLAQDVPEADEATPEAATPP